MESLLIRPEQPADEPAISRLTEVAFASEPHSSHTEQFIIDALRRHQQLTVSLVAVAAGQVVGHVAISPVVISSGAVGWYGLGPVAVEPARQQQGIGSRLIHAALTELRQRGAVGCVVLGEPGYYGRFGFQAEPTLVLPGVPPPYFQALTFQGNIPVGTVRYHEAFEATA
ncbi:GNAT family N-acetyltransferase [Hymenobacter properus]|uniref:N-acetyltransferase n=1 Tax=Hymenobacter properus TaxID=2791026 RepID=A0A931BLA3_9BACT|nr:N-acetyltransferase [Hymenobacter properus]MBF9144392.1 N-acetyltransferase [Hymenobacter properus]MBR7723210.1 N-acetyltransferase [Microvirga sp. SRT04]